jgi:hypothetical protein
VSREDFRRPRQAVRGGLYPAMSLALALVLAGGAAGAVETTVVVRAKAKDAMFIGTSFGGARVVVRNAETGEILAQGLTEGGTGDPDVVMAETIRRGAGVTDARTARFKAVLNLNEPTLATIEVVAPRSQGQAMIRASTQVWLIPGKELGVDGLTLEIPGFAVDLLEPRAAGRIGLSDGKATIPVSANVVMMCGCPVTPGGIWDAARYEVAAMIFRDGDVIGTVPLTYAGESNKFAGTVEVHSSGTYDLRVYAYDPRTGNTGVDRTVIRVVE